MRADHPGAALLAAILVALSLVLPASPADARKPKLPLERVRDVRLPGSPSRFDYQDIDPTRNRLFIAHLGANQVDVVDLPTLQVVGVVHAISEVHGVRAAPDLGITYASATSTDTVIAIDASALTIRFDAPTGDFPDGLAYDPDDGAVFVSDKNAGSVTSFDAQTGEQMRTVKVADETGNVVYDAASHTVFAAATPPDRLVSFDPRTGDIITRIDLPGCKGAHGVYLEPSARLAFVACERNALVSVIDLTAMKQVATNSVGKDPDVLAYDTASGASTSRAKAASSPSSHYRAPLSSSSVRRNSPITRIRWRSSPRAIGSSCRSSESTAIPCCVSCDRPAPEAPKITHTTMGAPHWHDERWPCYLERRQRRLLDVLTEDLPVADD